MRLCAVSVDLDEVHHYHAIHGLATASANHAVYDLAVDRLETWARSENLPLTWFVVGSDLSRAENREKILRLFRRGDEIGNHTQHHHYDITRRGPEEQRAEIVMASEEIQSLTGERPLGFRAPGYTVSDELLNAVRDTGHRYDSSVFPCPSYYAAKAAAWATRRLRGQRSRALLDTPHVLRAPTRPYRVGTPYFRPGDGLVELPIQVTPVVRLPFIGTTLTVAGPHAARLITRSLLNEAFINLELHGMDALGMGDPGLDELVRDQPDVRVPAARKLEALSAVVGLLKRAGFGFVRLDEAARLTPS